jgi:hypothetical protein
MEQYNIKSKINYRQALEKNTLLQKSKQTKKQTNKAIMMMVMIIIIIV